MKFTDFTYKELLDIDKKNSIVILPTGCTEQQGPHLPVDFDTWLANRICLSIAEKIESETLINVLVLPSIPFGPTPEHKNFLSGYINITQKKHEEFVKCILLSLNEQNFRKIIIWKGCGQHNFDKIIKELETDLSFKSNIYIPQISFPDIWLKYGNSKGLGGHADSFTTSLALYLRSDCVRKNELVEPVFKNVNWNDPDLDFTKYTNNGVIGSPLYSSAEIGERIWYDIIEQGKVEFLKILQ